PTRACCCSNGKQTHGLETRATRPALLVRRRQILFRVKPMPSHDLALPVELAHEVRAKEERILVGSILRRQDLVRATVLQEADQRGSVVQLVAHNLVQQWQVTLA